jgi:glycosyltransferase involved in cell wall biosynthesis
MKLNVLLSAMHLDNYKYIDTLNITTDCVVINQCDKNDIQIVSDNGRKIKFISVTERGLSRSRNMAISNSDADICILCDNDVEYQPDYESTILKAFEINQGYDVILFFVKNNPSSKPYSVKQRRVSYLLTMKASSYEIAFRRKSIEDKDIKFNTLFGAGSKYSMGEENIFLYDCLKKGLKVYYVPLKIAELRYQESTWFRGFNRKYFQDRGAIFYEMSNVFSIVLIVSFALRKRKLYRNETSMNNALRFMLEGRSCHKQEL